MKKQFSRKMKKIPIMKNSNKKLSRKKRKYPFPKKYYQGLSAENKAQQIKELKKSQKLYKQGIYIARSKKASFNSKRSPHLVEFERKYGVNIANKKDVFKATGITPKAQEKVLNKGRGAFYSSGSRPNQSAESWALARLASVILKHGAYKVDRHILIENNCNNIKPPPKKQQSGGKKQKSSKSKVKSKSNIITCDKINNINQYKFKQCMRKSDGKLFDLPRRFSPSKCEKPKGFTMRSSCTPYTSN